MARASDKHKKNQIEFKTLREAWKRMPIIQRREEAFGVGLNQQALSGHDFQLSTHRHFGLARELLLNPNDLCLQFDYCSLSLSSPLTPFLLFHLVHCV